VSKDISAILSGWPYEPDAANVRIVQGLDGKEKIQLRIDLGLMQMEFHGRPDGFRPHGHESWLEYYEFQKVAHDQENPDGPPFVLEPEDCGELLREGVQYYHRYLSFWHLRRFELCARDTRRNLQLFALVRQSARRDQDKLQFDQWRPYVTMMHTKAVATPLVELRQIDSARSVIQRGISEIRQFLVDYGQEHRAKQCSELVYLKKWLKSLGARQQTASEMYASTDRMAELRAELEGAIAAERFEDAARIRDEINAVRNSGRENERA
jgi:UvrB/UvrC motif-containing protein